MGSIHTCPSSYSPLCLVRCSSVPIHHVLVHDKLQNPDYHHTKLYKQGYRHINFHKLPCNHHFLPNLQRHYPLSLDIHDCRFDTKREQLGLSLLWVLDTLWPHNLKLDGYRILLRVQPNPKLLLKNHPYENQDLRLGTM